MEMVRNEMEVHVLHEPLVLHLTGAKNGKEEIVEDSEIWLVRAYAWKAASDTYLTENEPLDKH